MADCRLGLSGPGFARVSESDAAAKLCAPHRGSGSTRWTKRFASKGLDQQKKGGWEPQLVNEIRQMHEHTCK